MATGVSKAGDGDVETAAAQHVETRKETKQEKRDNISLRGAPSSDQEGGVVVDAKGGDGDGGPIDPEAEKKLIRKCDLHVLPPITVLFFLAFMDRTNIGNARIQGMSKDLNMTGRDYNLALFIFFIPVSTQRWRNPDERVRHMEYWLTGVHMGVGAAVYPVRGPFESDHQETCSVNVAQPHHDLMG